MVEKKNHGKLVQMNDEQICLALPGRERHVVGKKKIEDQGTLLTSGCVILSQEFQGCIGWHVAGLGAFNRYWSVQSS